MKDKIINGRGEKLLSLNEIAKEKGFNPDKFYGEYEFLSQFIHTTPFANDLTTEDGIHHGLISGLYDIICAYYVGSVIEMLQIIIPTHPQVEEINKEYQKIITKHWK